MCGAFCCIGTAACCAGEIFCSLACCLCKACGIKPKNFPRITYVLFDFFWIMISFLLMFILKPAFEHFSWLDCNSASGGGSACFGTSAVIRMSFVLFIFHLLILLIIIPRATCSSNFHDGLWLLKFLLILGLYIAVFWIPNSFYMGWAWFARIVSGIYLILQCLLIIIGAYAINDFVVGTYEGPS